MSRERREKSITLCLIVLLILVDQLSKFFVHFALNGLPQQSFPIIKNFFHLTLVQNKGTAFGLLRNQSFFFILVSFVAVILISHFLFFKKERDKRLRIPLCLILAGAAGNLIDRLVFGFVIDFLDFRIWPVFNFADSFICVGVGLIVVRTIRHTCLSDGGQAPHA
ncbi:MAG: signal peptidase II [Candidatus Omnitrophica bacterium]|nr:signal peptidase II [Candidatus Omnitrophota bacterium]